MIPASFPPKACPTQIRCELLGPAECSGACKPRAVAVTPAPIPLQLGHLSEAERSMGIVRLTEGLQRLLRWPRQQPPSEPFLSLTQEAPPVSDFLAPPHEQPVTITPEPPAKPAAPPSTKPVKSGPRPSKAVQVIPVPSGGFVVLGDSGPIAVALDAAALAAAVQRWANCELTSS